MPVCPRATPSARRTPLRVAGVLAVGLLALAAHALAAPAGADPNAAPAGIVTADGLRASMLASDSIMIARVTVENRYSIDTSGTPHSEVVTRRVFLNQVKAPWMKRLVANLLPAGAPDPSPDPCATPRAGAGLDRPWMLTALWIEKSGGRGQVYLNLVNGCATLGLAGARPGGLGVAAHTDSLLALFQEGLFADSLLRHLPARALPDTSAAADIRRPETLPEVLHRVDPAFSDSLRDAGVKGVVSVRVFLGADGSVRKAELLGGTSGFEDAALAAVKQWRFKPATSGGVPHAGWVTVAVAFPPAGPAAPSAK